MGIPVGYWEGGIPGTVPDPVIGIARAQPMPVHAFLRPPRHSEGPARALRTPGLLALT